MAAGRRYHGGEDFRAVQFTPPHSECSVTVGRASPPPHLAPFSAWSWSSTTSTRRARTSSAEVSTSASRFTSTGPASCRDLTESLLPHLCLVQRPGWQQLAIQEIRTRLAGREWDDCGGSRGAGDLLHETALHHGEFEAVAPPHNWWDWYAAWPTPARAAARRTKRPLPPDATWPRSSTSSSRRRDAREQHRAGERTSPTSEPTSRSPGAECDHCQEAHRDPTALRRQP